MGATRPVCLMNGCIVYSAPFTIPLADVHEMSFDRCGGGHHGADQMRAAAFALASFEIAIGSAGGAFAAGQNVVIHADAHAAAGVAPFETGVDENFIQAFFFGLRFHYARAGDGEGLLDVFCDMLAFDHVGGGAKIFDARIGAGADEDAVDGNIGDWRARLKVHVDERALGGLFGQRRR